ARRIAATTRARSPAGAAAAPPSGIATGYSLRSGADPGVGDGARTPEAHLPPGRRPPCAHYLPSGLSPSVQEFHLVNRPLAAVGSRTVTAGSELHRPRSARTSVRPSQSATPALLGSGLHHPGAERFVVVVLATDGA